MSPNYIDKITETGVPQGDITRFCRDCVHCDKTYTNPDFWMCMRPRRHETVDIVTGEKVGLKLPAIKCRDERTYTAAWAGCNPEGYFFKSK